MLEPLSGKFPRIKLLSGDSHYAGDMILWLLQHMGWFIEIVQRLKDSPNYASNWRSGCDKRRVGFLFWFSSAQEKMGC